MKVKDILKAVEPKWISNKLYNEYNPKVTVVLPTFCRAKSGYFERAVESVINQKYKNWELIIVDDASEDGTEDLIRFYMDLDSRINCIRHTYNLGLPAISQYEAYMKSRGEYIAYIFDDNVWDENHLLLSMKAMIKNNVKFTYGIARSYDKNLDFTDICFDLHLLPLGNCIGNGAVVIHKDIIEIVGLYDPHLSLTRNCDWDLWKRIYKIYYMQKIDNVVTTEYGVGLDDSLGNTLDMNVWVSLEQISYERNNLLLPVNFEEYDIINIKSSNTQLFYDYILKYYEKYKNKKWFIETFNTNQELLSPKKRILLVVPSLEATYTLGFEFLNYTSINRVILFSSLTDKDLALVDAVVYVRNPVLSNQFAERFKKYNIRSFYYIDDNFVELSNDETVKKESRDYNIINQWSKFLNRKNMSLFSKIIVSTKHLKNYFLNKDMHNDIELLPPCYDVDSLITYSKIFDTINIAFMGGEFREKSFVKYIYPSLLKLSEQKTIKLVCPRTLIEKIKDRYIDNSNIIFIEIERDACYNQIVCKYRKENIHILIHSGEENKNNKFKTKNALINAVSLGAVLLASNIEPYSDTKEIIVCDNTVDSWYNKINSIVSDDILRVNQFEIQKKYVTDNFSMDVVNDIFNNIINHVPSISTADVINRYENILLMKNTEVVNVVNEILKYDYDYIDKLLCFSSITNKTIDYYLKPNFIQFSKIGIIFSSDYSSYDGVLSIQLYNDKNNLISDVSMNIKDIKIRQYTYFDFGQVILPTKKMKLKITVKYFNSDNATIGVYESRMKKNIILKIVKKLTGVRIPVKNLLYYDLK